MANGVYLKVAGLDRLQKKFKGLAQSVVTEVDGNMEIAAQDFVTRAVNDVLIDQSILKQGISYVKKSEMNYEVVSAANYSAYVEFGTKKRTKIPADLTAYAAQFKGKGGKAGGQGFYDNILAWVKRKGITASFATTGAFNVKTRKRSDGTSKEDKQIEIEQVAFMIYLSIMRNGIHAQPFFFKQRQPVFKQLSIEIKRTYKQALSK